MPSQRGSLISTTVNDNNNSNNSPYRFQPVNQRPGRKRARSASGYGDEYYLDSNSERSFVCSKPGFVCLAAVLFTISFIALAVFLEFGKPWPEAQGRNSTGLKGAGFGFVGSKQQQQNVKQTQSESSEEDNKVRINAEKEVEPVTDQPRDRAETPGKNPLVTTEPSLDIMSIYTPFDDAKNRTNRAIRALFDAHSYGNKCFNEFTFQEAAKYLQIDSSSESNEANNFQCKNLDKNSFQQVVEGKLKRDRRVKYLFVVRDPRSLIYARLESVPKKLEVCHDDSNKRCLYEEESLREAQTIVENWNKTVGQMIETCRKLRPDSCRIILIERLLIDLKSSLKDIGDFLSMDFELDQFRMLQKMIEKVANADFYPETEKQRKMFEIMDFFVHTISSTWPWTGRIPFNIYSMLQQWAPLMAPLGYGFSEFYPTSLDDSALRNMLNEQYVKP